MVRYTKATRHGAAGWRSVPRDAAGHRSRSPHGASRNLRLDEGTLEKQFVDLLCGKVKQGVKVRLLVDAIGASGADGACFKRLTDSGVEFAQYCRPHWVNLRRFNQRTHRKLLIVDGHIGYVFGHGIADQWLGKGQDRKHWRDTAVRVEGPVVRALQAVFMENWIEETHCVPSGLLSEGGAGGECDRARFQQRVGR